jgi:hypothetical protein
MIFPSVFGLEGLHPMYCFCAARSRSGNDRIDLFDKVATDDRSMISMYVDCECDVMSLAAYLRVGVTTSGI